jgi:glycosyl hydrolase family 99/dockerin type I repeat protein
VAGSLNAARGSPNPEQIIVNFRRYIAAALLVQVLAGTSVLAQSTPVPKTNPTKVYMHYMPWFQTPSSQGGTGGGSWGWHWKMNTQNPNIVDATGKRQIASHYYPKIGPYDSTDPNVLEYHMLLMKYSGVDGLAIDWYGQAGTNGDVGSLLTASNAIVNKTANYGLQFSVVLEDRFASGVNDVKTNMNYLKNNYFNKSNYTKAGTNNDPLMMIFGPINIQTQAQWTDIFSSTGTNPEFITLPYQSGDAGTNADGEFAWPYQDPNTTDHLQVLHSFDVSRAPSQKTVSGVAYPGFNDFYQPGGAGSTLFYIPENNGATLASTLNEFNSQQFMPDGVTPKLDMLQLATFNDFGEGTMFEPTVETGFTYLHQIQQFTGVSYGEDELQLIYELYLARKKYAGQAGKQTQLDQVTADLNALDVAGARALLDTVSPPGDYNGDGLVNAADYTVWNDAYSSSTIIYGKGADGNYDGKIDTADYTIWRDNYRNGTGSGGLSAVVPEPTALTLSLIAATAILMQARLSRPHVSH